jgi:hypothetical protein
MLAGKIKAFAFAWIVWIPDLVLAQAGGSFIHFPAPLEKPCRFSAGLTFTTTPREVTEEFHMHVPAADLYLVKQLPKNTQVESRLRFQFFQNELSSGYKWLLPLSHRLGISIGNNISVWGSLLKIEGFDTRGYGFLIYPNASIGYGLPGNLFFTLRTDFILNIYQRFYVGNNSIEKQPSPFSGYSLSLLLEQPFYREKSLVLGFRTLYCNFYWQTWALYETFERYTFYPELIISYIFK